MGVGLDAKTRLAYARAEELLSPLNVPVDLAAAQYAEARCPLADVGVGIVEAARDYAHRHAGIMADKPVADAVAELIGQIEAEQKNTTNGTRRKATWAKLLRSHLGKVSRDFNCPVAALDSSQIEPWLAGLKSSERTRRNVRDCLAYFLRWAKARNYLPKDADPLANVQTLRKRKRGAVEVITAEQLARLFEQAPADLVPYLALRAFASQPRFRQAGFLVGALEEFIAERQEFLGDAFEELGSLRPGRFAIRRERRLGQFHRGVHLVRARRVKGRFERRPVEGIGGVEGIAAVHGQLIADKILSVQSHNEFKPRRPDFSTNQYR